MLLVAELLEPGKCVFFISQLLSEFEVVMFYLYLSQYGSSLLKYVWGGKTSKRVQKKKKERQAGLAAGAISKPAQALKDEIHFVSSSAPSPPDESSGGEEGEKEMERKTGSDICLICQKFFNLIYSCQDAEDPDLITAFYLADSTPGTPLKHTHTHTSKVCFYICNVSFYFALFYYLLCFCLHRNREQEITNIYHYNNS